MGMWSSPPVLHPQASSGRGPVGKHPVCQQLALPIVQGWEVAHFGVPTTTVLYGIAL